MPQLRPYRPDDWDEFLKLDLETGLVGSGASEAERSAYRARWPDYLRRHYGFGGAAPPPAEHGSLTVLEASDGAYAGHVWVREQADLFTGLPRLFVVTLAVTPRHRGRGYGKLLMAHVEDQARRLGLAEITLGVTSENAVARSLYRTLGYREARLTLRKRLDV